MQTVFACYNTQNYKNIEGNYCSIALCKSSEGVVNFGERFFHKMEWFVWPPELNLIALTNPNMMFVSATVSGKIRF